MFKTLFASALLALFVAQAVAITCNPGEYDNGACTACPKGTYNNVTNPAPSSCTDCPPGYYANTTGSASCMPCPAGSYAKGGYATCNRCDLGRFASASAMSVCKDCDPGYFATIGAANCTACPIGQFSTRPQTVVCASCGRGFFTKDVGSTSCTSCTVDPTNTQCANSIVNRVSFGLNTTTNVASSTAKTEFTQDIASTVMAPTSRVNVLSATPTTITTVGTVGSITQFSVKPEGTINYMKPTFDLLPSSNSSDKTSSDLFDILGAAFAATNSSFYNGTWTKYTLTQVPLVREILVLCSDNSIQAKCPDPKDTSLTGGAIAGIVIGVIAFLVIVAVLCYCRNQKK